jgi:hypothetical protein
MIERLHPKQEYLTENDWKRTQDKIDELVDMVNDLTDRYNRVIDRHVELADLIYGCEDDDDDYWGDNLCHCGDVEEPHHHTIPAISSKESEAAILVNDFVNYCRRSPELRFWQALCNWSGYTSIFGSTAPGWAIPDNLENLEDTYNLETKGPKQPEMALDAAPTKKRSKKEAK